MRLFIAIYLSKEVDEELARIQDYLVRPGVRGTPDFHITLKFLGELSEKDLEKIKKSLSSIDFESFKIKLKEMTVFRNKPIRVVHCDLDASVNLMKLADQIHEATEWIERDYPFMAHISTNRVKFLKNKKEFVDKIRDTKVKKISCLVEKFCLIKSVLTEKGPEYEVLEEYLSK